MPETIRILQELSKIPFFTVAVNAVVIFVSIYFGYYLGERSQIKRDKKEAIQILNILHDEVNDNLNNNLQDKFSYKNLSTLGEEVLRIKMGILSTHQNEQLGCFIKIYGQFNNINKALSNYIELEKGRSSSKKIRAYEEIVQLRSSCKEDIKTYLKKTCG